MTMMAAWLNLNEPSLVSALQEAAGRLDGTEGEVVLDFASVRRIGPSALRAMEEFANTAEKSGVRVLLRGVNVDVYKVLKLVKLTPGFSFER